ncbi:MAG: hypothetical protein IPO27_09365 [Bacteroidetes bacterium]|nr:hypothetical protein [Bacteroidota bacterium]
MKAHYQLVINLALVALLLVYAIPMLYAVPTADDYCSGVYQHLGFVEFILYYAKLYTGRLGAVALMYFTPLAGSPVSYSFGLLACWAFLIFSIFLFSYKLFSKPEISTTFALLFSCCYMACLINPSETLYWFTGVATYTVAVSFVFCLLGFMQFKTNVLIALMCMVLGFIIPLFSELFIIPLLFLLCYINIKKAVFSLHLRVNARYALVGLVTGTALFACMPGNWVRLDQYHNNLNLFSAAGTALFYSIIFIFRISFHPVMIISLFLIAIYIDEIKQHTKLREIKGQLPYNGAMFLIFMACFIPAFFTGILGQHRTIDAVIPFVIFLFWYWVFLLSWD